MKLQGAIVYRGPSMLTGAPILCALTGFDTRSLNPKTGSVVQSWILRDDMMPMAALRQSADDAICGSCALRGEQALNRRCYVPVWIAPTAVFKNRAAYTTVTLDEASAILEGRVLRMGSYGDPSALPFATWQALIRSTRSWVAYTHAWRTCDPRFKTIAMASVETLEQLLEAQSAGWRTFRVRAMRGEDLIDEVETVCPASAEAGHRTTCAACELCRGQANPARSIAIRPHGHNGTMAAFHRSRRAAEARA